MKEEQVLLNHLHDLADVCYQRDIPVYTDFLNLNEQTVFLSALPEFSYVRCHLDGGYEGAERKIVCFLPVVENSAFSQQSVPICALKIASAAGKFSSACSHRDYLGAVLNLGIDRAKTGDILTEEREAFLICHTSMKEFIMQELCSVRHNPVLISEVLLNDLSSHQHFTEIQGSIASNRMDSLLSLILKESRSKASDCLEAEKVYLNGKLCLSRTASLKEGDVISVRGVGKFIYDGVQAQTKKGRQMVHVRKYD